MLVITLFCCFYKLANGRKYIWECGSVSFTVLAPAGELIAVDSQVVGFFDAATGDMVFTVPVNGFRFVSAFMPEYINRATTKRLSQYYLEADIYPDASFKGRALIRKNSALKPGTYKIQSSGQLSLHGVSRKISRPVMLVIKEGYVLLETSFVIHLPDYKIRVPETLTGFFFKEVEVRVKARLRQEE